MFPRLKSSLRYYKYVRRFHLSVVSEDKRLFEFVTLLFGVKNCTYINCIYLENNCVVVNVLCCVLMS